MIYLKRFFGILFFLSLSFSCSARAKLIVICHDQIVSFLKKECDFDIREAWENIAIEVAASPSFMVPIEIPWPKELAAKLNDLWLKVAEVIGVFRKKFSGNSKDFLDKLEQCGTVEPTEREELKKALEEKYRKGLRRGGTRPFKVKKTDLITFWIGFASRLSLHFTEDKMQLRRILCLKNENAVKFFNVPNLTMVFEVDRRGSVQKVASFVEGIE